MGFIHFLCFQNITPRCFRDAFRHPIRTWDALFNELAIFKPYTLLGNTDNPMAAVLANSIGMNGNHPCWFCFYGGPDVWQKTKEGFIAALQVHISFFQASV
jgi:hypothetical protein